MNHSLDIEQVGSRWRVIRRWRSATRHDVRSGDILAIRDTKEQAEQTRQALERSAHPQTTDWEW